MNNPKTEEIVATLRHCATHNCIMCPAYSPPNSKCFETLAAACDRLEWLEKELSKLKAQQRWIPVTERLPEALEIVLTICVDRRKNSEIHRRINCCDAIGEWLMTPPLYAVTHWMPLPEPPKEEQHESERVPKGN